MSEPTNEPSANTSDQLLAALLGITYSGDFAAARAFVDANASLTPEVRGNLHNFIAGQWARYEPEAAAAWAMQPSPPQENTLQRPDGSVASRGLPTV